MNYEAFGWAENEALKAVQREGSLKPRALIIDLTSNHGLSEDIAQAAMLALVDRNLLHLTPHRTLVIGSTDQGTSLNVHSYGPAELT